MAVYVVAAVKINDDSWLPDYVTNVHEIVGKHGGKYLSRSANINSVEGEPLDANVVALLEFPSSDAANAFYNDPGYEPYRQARIAGSVSTLYTIDDTDVAGTIPYLAKG